VEHQPHGPAVLRRPPGRGALRRPPELRPITGALPLAVSGDGPVSHDPALPRRTRHASGRGGPPRGVPRQLGRTRRVRLRVPSPWCGRRSPGFRSSTSPLAKHPLRRLRRHGRAVAAGSGARAGRRARRQATREDAARVGYRIRHGGLLRNTAGVLSGAPGSSGASASGQPGVSEPFGLGGADAWYGPVGTSEDVSQPHFPTDLQSPSWYQAGRGSQAAGHGAQTGFATPPRPEPAERQRHAERKPANITTTGQPPQHRPAERPRISGVEVQLHRGRPTALDWQARTKPLGLLLRLQGVSSRAITDPRRRPPWPGTSPPHTAGARVGRLRPSLQHRVEHGVVRLRHRHPA